MISSSLPNLLVPVSPNVASVLGWMSCGILLAGLCNRYLPWPKGCRDNPLIFCGIALLTLLPVGNHPGLAAGLHGMLGTPSGTLLQLSFLAFLNRPWPNLPPRNVLLLGITLVIGFYALSLGVGRMLISDPYTLGFLPTFLWLPLLGLGYWLYRKNQTGWLIILTVDLAMWRLGLHSSRNLWDVLFDPLLIVALLWLAFHPQQHEPRTKA
jgi:hypothetical protein